MALSIHPKPKEETLADRYLITIDGIDVSTRAVEADESQGFVTILATDEHGCPIFTLCQDGNYRAGYHRVKGQVRIMERLRG